MDLQLNTRAGSCKEPEILEIRPAVRVPRQFGFKGKLQLSDSEVRDHQKMELKSVGLGLRENSAGGRDFLWWALQLTD